MINSPNILIEVAITDSQRVSSHFSNVYSVEKTTHLSSWS